MYQTRLTEILTDTHVYFCSGYLSNFFSAPFTHQNVAYTCSEQFYMYYKAKYFGENEIAEKILTTPEPKDQKKLGRSVKNFDRDVWLEPSIKVMRLALLLKFTANPKLLSLLLASYVRSVTKGVNTGVYYRKFVEAAPWDKIWGIGMGLNSDDIYDETKWLGLNLLGESITTISEFIVEKISYNPTTREYNEEKLSELVEYLRNYKLELS